MLTLLVLVGMAGTAPVGDITQAMSCRGWNGYHIVTICPGSGSTRKIQVGSMHPKLVKCKTSNHVLSCARDFEAGYDIHFGTTYPSPEGHRNVLGTTWYRGTYTPVPEYDSFICELGVRAQACLN